MDSKCLNAYISLQFEKVLRRLASFNSLDLHFCFHCCKKKGSSSSLRILNCSTRISNIQKFQNKLSLEMASKYIKIVRCCFFSLVLACFGLIFHLRTLLQAASMRLTVVEALTSTAALYGLRWLVDAGGCFLMFSRSH